MESFISVLLLVLDNCMGRGTTAIACKYLNRHFIGFEISKKYCDIAMDYIKTISVNLELYINPQKKIN